MKRLDRQTTGALVKLLVFMAVTSVATAMLVVTIGNISFDGSREYRAVFSDATGVVKGDEIRVAGVKVGVVRDVEVHERTRALVTFTVDDRTQMTGATTATIRYRNLVGQRYISLAQGIGDAGRLDAGSTIPLERTAPALDLTVLFNGFKPLFQALSPADLNKLSFEVVAVFQGEGGTLESLLQSTASVTSTLADRDQLIGDLIDNLDQVLDHLGDRDQQLSELIVSFRDLVGGLRKDRDAILGPLEDISDLSVETASLVSDIRQPFVRDVQQLRALAGNIDRNKAELDRALQVLPIKLEKIGRTATYGSFFNFYLCNFQGTVTLPGGRAVELGYPFPGMEIADRCNLGSDG